MKKIYLSAAMLALATSAYSQFSFPVEIDTVWSPTSVIFPPSPLKYQVLFVGQADSVATLDANGQPNGYEPAKQWHDFIGFTPASDAEGGLGWVSVNHEMVQANAKIGDGGGMTTFKIARDPNTDTLIVLNQTLEDGRTGKYFNVDFVNTVGETGMNCGGIVSPVDGRIWTAEEWFRTSNTQIFANGGGFTDTTDFTVGTTGLTGNFDGQTVKRFENLNWMVEIDPRQAKAIRKQYNWSRGSYEGGAIMPDNRTVYLGEDATPGALLKFVANTPGDFTSGDLFIYKHDAPGAKWVLLPNTTMESMINRRTTGLQQGGTIFNRIEWMVVDTTTGKVYMSETGRDTPGSRFGNGIDLGGVLAPHHFEIAISREPGLANVAPDSLNAYMRTSAYKDYYGRVLVYDPATDEVEVYVEGGPFYAPSESQPISEYPDKHFSNPDGLNILFVNGKRFMAICEDLNGRSFNRVPAGVSNSICELFLLDMDIANPTVDDLVRIAITPNGAEITGACPTPDGKTLMVNSQHPSTSNPFPYNNSLTFAITGWDALVSSLSEQTIAENAGFQIWPNPAARELHFNQRTDVAIYNANGQRMKVVRNAQYVNVSDLTPGVYFVRNAKGETQRLIVQ